MPGSELMERKLSLFEIEQSLSMLMADRDEVTDPEEIAAVDAAIKEYVGQEIRKVDGIRGYIRHAETMVSAAKEEASRASSVAQAWQARIDRLKANCLVAMQEAGAKRLDGKAGYLIVKGNGGLAPLKIQDDILEDFYRDVTFTVPLQALQTLPEEFRMGFRPKSIEPSNARIREALKVGPIPGAHLEDRGQHVEIR